MRGRQHAGRAPCSDEDHQAYQRAAEQGVSTAPSRGAEKPEGLLGKPESRRSGREHQGRGEDDVDGSRAVRDEELGVHCERVQQRKSQREPAQSEELQKAASGLARRNRRTTPDHRGSR